MITQVYVCDTAGCLARCEAPDGALAPGWTREPAVGGGFVDRCPACAGGRLPTSPQEVERAAADLRAELRRQRLRMGMSQARLAAATGLSAPSVTAHEGGTREVSLSGLVRWAGVLGGRVTVVWERA